MSLIIPRGKEEAQKPKNVKRKAKGINWNLKRGSRLAVVTYCSSQKNLLWRRYGPQKIIETD